MLREPVGPVAAFTPWNFPATTPARKISGALAAGCTCVIKPAEETPLTCLALAAALAEAGLPDGVLNVVFGDAAAISHALLESPAIRKISFTGSTRVGRMLAEHAGRTLKKATLELGGHARSWCSTMPTWTVVGQVVSLKYRNAGQICISPTRFVVQEKAFGEFAERVRAYAGALRVGPGLDEKTQMGPLANQRRAQAIGELVENALGAGSHATAGSKPGGSGFFHAPTVLTDVPARARIMNEEPFGPVAVVNRRTFEDTIAEADRRRSGSPHSSSRATSRRRSAPRPPSSRAWSRSIPARWLARDAIRRREGQRQRLRAEPGASEATVTKSVARLERGRRSRPTRSSSARGSQDRVALHLQQRGKSVVHDRRGAAERPLRQRGPDPARASTLHFARLRRPHHQLNRTIDARYHPTAVRNSRHSSGSTGTTRAPRRKIAHVYAKLIEHCVSEHDARPRGRAEAS